MLLNKTLQHLLLQVARNSIKHGLQTGEPLKVNLTEYPPELLEHRATFVTLQKHKQLRGCIGMLQAVRPLIEDIAENAFAAAFEDPRFPRLENYELDALEIHLSILTHAEPLFFSSEQDLLTKIRPGIDGLILEEGNKRGTFLPSVWESLPKTEEFLQHLKQKAGLPPNYWSKNIKIYRYQTELIS